MAALVRFTRVSSCVAASAATLAVGLAATPVHDIARLHGNWNCSGIAPGSVATERYTRGRDGAIILENDEQTAKGALGTVVETFVFVRALRTWHLDVPANDDFEGMSLTANPPSGGRWTFTGTRSVHSKAVRIRIIYAFLGDGFRRTLQRNVRSGWQDDTSYFCLPDARGRAAFVRKPSGENLDRGVRAAQHHQATAHMQASVPSLISTPIPTPIPTPNATPTPRPTRNPIPEPTLVPMPKATSEPTLQPTPEPTPTSVPSPTALRTFVGVTAPVHVSRDRAFSLIGHWECLSTAGLPHKLTYTRAGNVVRSRTELVTARKPLTIAQTYTFDPKTTRWTTPIQDHAYSGVATPWLARTWVFDGTVLSGPRRTPERVVYTTLGANAFRHESERRFGEAWKTFQSETCRRS